MGTRWSSERKRRLVIGSIRTSAILALRATRIHTPHYQIHHEATSSTRATRRIACTNTVFYAQPCKTRRVLTVVSTMHRMNRNVCTACGRDFGIRIDNLNRHIRVCRGPQTRGRGRGARHAMCGCRVRVGTSSATKSVAAAATRSARSSVHQSLRNGGARATLRGSVIGDSAFEG
jgi:hypothetical protein